MFYNERCIVYLLVYALESNYLDAAGDAAAAAAEHAAARARRHGSAALTLAFPATLRVLTAPFAKLPDQLTCPRKDLFLRPACFAHQGERVGTKIDHGKGAAAVVSRDSRPPAALRRWGRRCGLSGRATR